MPISTFLLEKIYLENQEVPSLDENAKFFQLFTVFRQAHHLVVDAVLRGGT